jgi:hypothetical protein
MYIFITITESSFSAQMYHTPCFQRLDTDMVYAYIYYWNLQSINSVIIIKTKIHLNEALISQWGITRYLISCFCPLVFLLPNTFEIILAFQTFDY